MKPMDAPEKPDPCKEDVPLEPPSAAKVFAAPAADRRAFREQFFPAATDAQWNDWRWQCANSLSSPQDFARVLDLTNDERQALESGAPRLPARVTPYFAALFAAHGPGHPLRRTVTPSLDEFLEYRGQRLDPLAEDHDSPVPGLVHRYPDRALLLVTDTCFAYCRYCTRSRRVGGRDTGIIGRLGPALNYIAAHPEIRDVIVSGGDPLTLSDHVLDSLLTRLRAIEHVEILRIGTKAPIVLPQRVTPGLVKMLGKHHPLYLSIHCTHPAEITPESRRALEMLANAGIPLGSQTVLLSGVNDSPETMKSLFHGLLTARVRPYYLYHCDPVVGAGHFRTTVRKGIEIIEALRGHTSGYAVPHFVVDLPGGGGKVPVLPEYLISGQDGLLTFRNYEGNTFTVNENGPFASVQATAAPGKEILH